MKVELCDTKSPESFYLLSSLFMSGHRCVFARRPSTIGRFIHREPGMAEYTYLPSLFLSSSGDSNVAGISSGIKFLVTNFVTFTSPQERRQESRNRGTRGIYTIAASFDIVRIIVAKERRPLIVLSCVSISMATELHRWFVEKIVAAPAALIVRRGQPTG